VFFSGTSQNDDFDRARTDGRINSQLVHSIEQQLKMVASGRADFALAERNSGIHVTRNLGLESALLDLPAVVVSKPVYIAFNKSGRNQKTIDKLSKELTAMTIDGAMAKIAAQYGWVKDTAPTK
jgi:ABC-type amino acid transport substrate-binding protein